MSLWLQILLFTAGGGALALLFHIGTRLDEIVKILRNR